MEFKRVIKNEASKILPSTNDQYAGDLQMYIDPPMEVIDIEEFKLLAVERVKLLRVLETVYAKSGTKGRDSKQLILDELVRQNAKMFIPIVKGYADQETRRRDYISHFILRLCYCRSEEYRRWFLARELELFKIKFYNLERKEDLTMFMERNNINYYPISDSDKQSLKNELIDSTARNISFDLCSFYKVSFLQVPDLIKGRKVFIRAGYAYVPHHDLSSLLSSLFRSKLSLALSLCAANLPILEGDDRLAAILKSLHTSYTGGDYMSTASGQVTLSALDGLSRISFPPCMRTMYDTFKSTHHLRHQARLQMGLFLKGIGVSFDDSMKFWKDGFTQRPDIDGEKFQKQYAYNIRHSYGMEGKRANYTPHSCIKIISSNVGPGENHGCPFKHYDGSNLHKMLTSYGLSAHEATNITQIANSGHCQLACSRYFEVTHKVENSSGINHPNQYFEQSQQILTAAKEKNANKN